MKPSLRKRLFAWTLNRTESVNHSMYSVYKEKLFRDIEGTVVEIGPGNGINLRYLPSGISWIGIEPNEAFNKMVMEKAYNRGINATLLPGDAEHIPLADNSADVVLSTLVLCSVPDQLKAIEEMKRVVKPGGNILFIEHVASRRSRLLRIVQTLLNPFNRLIADGCHCNRKTWEAFEGAGFASLELTHHSVTGSFFLHTPHIMGCAVK